MSDKPKPPRFRWWEHPEIYPLVIFLTVFAALVAWAIGRMFWDYFAELGLLRGLAQLTLMVWALLIFFSIVLSRRR